MAPGLSTNGSVSGNQVITDEQAKTIARLWATENPQMMAFVRTGSIAYELIESLTADARMLEDAVANEDAPPVVARAQLRALTRYVQTHGPRGPIRGWQGVGQTDPVRGIIEPIVTETSGVRRSGSNGGRRNGGPDRAKNHPGRCISTTARRQVRRSTCNWVPRRSPT